MTDFFAVFWTWWNGMIFIKPHHLGCLFWMTIPVPCHCSVFVRAVFVCMYAYRNIYEKILSLLVLVNTFLPPSPQEILILTIFPGIGIGMESNITGRLFGSPFSYFPCCHSSFSYSLYFTYQHLALMDCRCCREYYYKEISHSGTNVSHFCSLWVRDICDVTPAIFNTCILFNNYLLHVLL